MYFSMTCVRGGNSRLPRRRFMAHGRITALRVAATLPFLCHLRSFVISVRHAAALLVCARETGDIILCYINRNNRRSRDARTALLFSKQCDLHDGRTVLRANIPRDALGGWRHHLAYCCGGVCTLSAATSRCAADLRLSALSPRSLTYHRRFRRGVYARALWRIFIALVVRGAFRTIVWFLFGAGAFLRVAQTYAVVARNVAPRAFCPLYA